MKRKLELRRLYDETAEIYDRRYAEIQKAKYEKILRHMPEKLGRALDLGCGTGLLLGELRKKAKVVIGVDASEKMLRGAKARGGEVVLADADHLPFRDRTFDLVASVTLLQNMPKPARTVKEIARVMKVGGTAALTSLGRKHSPENISVWAKRAGLRMDACGEIENSEDVFCIARK
ncbi:MAG: class I SAM-dependent methyltransferase [Candidatus Hadarchaeota archaeon]